MCPPNNPVAGTTPSPALPHAGGGGAGGKIGAMHSGTGSSGADSGACAPSPRVGEGRGGGGADAPGRVGPNAILQVEAALRAAGGEALARRVFADAGLLVFLDAPPDTMIDERAVARLHGALARDLPDPEAEALARDAGRRTARYILDNRIPRLAQRVLRALPAGPAARLLLAAIGRSAWTFAGSGRFSGKPGRPTVIELAANPLATPGCPWHRGVFEGLFTHLVSPGSEVVETACCARGAPACRFEIRF